MMGIVIVRTVWGVPCLPAFEKNNTDIHFERKKALLRESVVCCHEGCSLVAIAQSTRM